jgi:2-polyprenyl-6-methoxyphenol hydroxylase-like FAD-dependent oxidoreductase
VALMGCQMHGHHRSDPLVVRAVGLGPGRLPRRPGPRWLGNGPVALVCALFVARSGTVLLAARPSAAQPAVESGPATLLTLLLELGVATVRRVARLSVPVAAGEPRVVPVGDAALARDALAAQGTSIGLSDARLAAGETDIAGQAADGRERHLRSLGVAQLPVL